MRRVVGLRLSNTVRRGVNKGKAFISQKIIQFYSKHKGPGSSVGIATGYELDGPVIESRCGAKFSATVQTGPGAHPASCTMGTGSFSGVKSGRGVELTTHSHLAPRLRKE